MESIPFGVALGLGALLVFDALARPEGQLPVTGWVRRLGPRGAGAVAGAITGLTLFGWEVALVAGALVGGLAPSALLQLRAERRHVERMEAVAEVAFRIRGALQAGAGVYEALIQAAHGAPGVIASDLQRLVADAKVSGLTDAAARFAARAGDPASQLFASALGLADRLGSAHTSELLHSLRQSASARAATLREARARQTHHRMSANLVAAAPLLLLLAIKRQNPAFLEPFDTLAGQMVLALAFAFIAAGYWLMLRMARVERGAGR
ncbi:MAG: type II secretion system F family protein [Actinomycetota bacterium]